MELLKRLKKNTHDDSVQLLFDILEDILRVKQWGIVFISILKTTNYQTLTPARTVVCNV